MKAGEKEKVKVTFGEINLKNFNVLRKINVEVLPVKYGTAFYQRLALENTQNSKFCYYNDIIIGAYTARVEDYKGEKRAYILTFGVLPAYRKQGIGYLLMESLEQAVKEQKEVAALYLHMHVKNEGGKQFYEKCGFIVEERLENYYTDLEEPHSFILVKRIQRGEEKANENGKEKTSDPQAPAGK
jgi:ribosomal protein S18 acetylase RimI-like enzyme